MRPSAWGGLADSEAVLNVHPWARTVATSAPARKCLSNLTRAFVAVPCSLSRPQFETAYELNWPLYDNKFFTKFPERGGGISCRPQKLKDGNISMQHRCPLLHTLPKLHRRWVVIDSVPNPPINVRPLSTCAPDRVMVACLSCSRDVLRPGIDTGMPPPTFPHAAGVFPSTRQEVSQRCKSAHFSAFFRGKNSDALRRAIASLNGTMVPRLGPVHISFNDFYAGMPMSDPNRGDGAGKTPATSNEEFDALLRTSNFGFAPRGDARFSCERASG